MQTYFPPRDEKPQGFAGVLSRFSAFPEGVVFLQVIKGITMVWSIFLNSLENLQITQESLRI